VDDAAVAETEDKGVEVVVACAETSCEINTTNEAIKIIDPEDILPTRIAKAMLNVNAQFQIWKLQLQPV